jgi:hypothetical protein
MNAVAHTIPVLPTRTPIVEKLLRESMADPKKKNAILEETGWDPSMPSKILSNTAGITLEHLDTVLRTLGLIVTTVAYMDYLATGNEIGSNCHCARMSMGACGSRR